MINNTPWAEDNHTTNYTGAPAPEMDVLQWLSMNLKLHL